MPKKDDQPPIVHRFDDLVDLAVTRAAMTDKPLLEALIGTKFQMSIEVKKPKKPDQ